MNEATVLSQTLQLAAIGIPIMFCVIAIFIGLIKLLWMVFPYKEEE